MRVLNAIKGKEKRCAKSIEFSADFCKIQESKRNSKLAFQKGYAPLFSDGVVIGEIDIDSTELSTFDDVDREYLEKAAEIIAQFMAKFAKTVSCRMQIL